MSPICCGKFVALGGPHSGPPNRGPRPRTAPRRRPAGSPSAPRMTSRCRKRPRTSPTLILLKSSNGHVFLLPQQTADLKKLPRAFINHTFKTYFSSKSFLAECIKQAESLRDILFILLNSRSWIKSTKIQQYKVGFLHKIHTYIFGKKECSKT